MTFLTNRPGTMVVHHHAEVGERVHRILPDCLLSEFADIWTRLACEESAVRR